MTTASATAEAKTPATPLDEFGQATVERAKGIINELNSNVKVLKASQGDAQATLEALRENPPTDDAAKLTAAIEEIDNKREALFVKRDEILKPLVAEQMEAAKNGSEGVQAKVDDLKKKVAAALKYIKELYGEEHLEGLPKVEGVRAPSTGSNAGAGGKRVRGFDFYVDGKLITTRNAQGKEVSNLAAAAKELNVAADDLRDAFYAAAGTTENKKAPAVVEFAISAGEGDARKSYNITAKRVNEGEARATEPTDASASEVASED